MSLQLELCASLQRCASASTNLSSPRLLGGSAAHTSRRLEQPHSDKQLTSSHSKTAPAAQHTQGHVIEAPWLVNG
eukprot:COSAG01_NODE_55393_length_325_cov_0.911504_1_plen_74_part_10